MDSQNIKFIGIAFESNKNTLGGAHCAPNFLKETILKDFSPFTIINHFPNNDETRSYFTPYKPTIFIGGSTEISRQLTEQWIEIFKDSKVINFKEEFNQYQKNSIDDYIGDLKKKNIKNLYLHIDLSILNLTMAQL